MHSRDVIVHAVPNKTNKQQQKTLFLTLKNLKSS